MNPRLPKRSTIPGWRGCWRLPIWSLTGSCSSTRSRPLPGAPTVGDFIGLSKITSPTGHDGFLTETRQLTIVLDKFLTKAALLAQR